MYHVGMGTVVAASLLDGIMGVFGIQNGAMTGIFLNFFWQELFHIFAVCVIGMNSAPAGAHVGAVLSFLEYLPYFISTVVLVAMLQILLSPTTGVLSNALRTFGLVGEKTNLLGDPSAFVPVYVISGIWQSAGWNSIIFIAALAAVDGQLYDAAKVDGANRWQQVWHVELPAILPTIIILLIMNMGGILSVGFEKTYLMQNSMNKGVSEVISTYVYNVGLKSSQFSFGSAVGLFNTVVNFVFLVLANQISRRVANISLV